MPFDPTFVNPLAKRPGSPLVAHPSSDAFLSAACYTKVNLHLTLCGNELGKNVKNFQKIVETFPHGPLIRGVFKEFIFSKIA